jgi:hypothetical protein
MFLKKKETTYNSLREKHIKGVLEQLKIEKFSKDSSELRKKLREQLGADN